VHEDRSKLIVFELEKKEAKRGGRKLQMMNFMLCPYYQASSVCGRTGVLISSWSENMKKETTWKM
jgi:hypothetical protein